MTVQGIKTNIGRCECGRPAPIGAEHQMCQQCLHGPLFQVCGAPDARCNCCGQYVWMREDGSLMGHPYVFEGAGLCQQSARRAT